MAAAEQITAYRSTQQMTAICVALQDVYDEFNHGVVDPRAMAEIMRQWSTFHPEFALVVLFSQ